jgi:hypothetical protein
LRLQFDPEALASIGEKITTGQLPDTHPMLAPFFETCKPGRYVAARS